MSGTFSSIPAIDMSLQARHRTPLGGIVSRAEPLRSHQIGMSPAIFPRAADPGPPQAEADRGLQRATVVLLQHSQHF